MVVAEQVTEAEALGPVDREDIQTFRHVVNVWLKDGVHDFDSKFFAHDDWIDNPALDASESLRGLASLFQDNSKETVSRWVSDDSVEYLFALGIADKNTLDANGNPIPALEALCAAIGDTIHENAPSLLIDKANTELSKEIYEITLEAGQQVANLVDEFLDSADLSPLRVTEVLPEQINSNGSPELSTALRGLVKQLIERQFSANDVDVSFIKKDLERALAGAYKLASAWAYVLAERESPGRFKPEVVARRLAIIEDPKLKSYVVPRLRLLAAAIRPLGD